MKNSYIIITLCLISIHADSQSISRHMVSSGGGQFQNGDIILNYTIGEPFIDLKSTDGSTSINAGFWPTVNATSQSDVVLAAAFMQFSVFEKDNNALLKWSVANETSATGSYNIERSLNAFSFNKIGSIQPKYNASSVINYNFTDHNVSSLTSSGILYYRIKQVDKDGGLGYSDTKMIRISNTGIGVNVYPNPFKNIANLTVNLAQNSNADISVYDMTGRAVKTKQAQLSKGSNIIQIDTKALIPGYYMLKVQTATENKTVPVIKIN